VYLLRVPSGVFTSLCLHHVCHPGKRNPGQRVCRSGLAWQPLVNAFQVSQWPFLGNSILSFHTIRVISQTKYQHFTRNSGKHDLSHREGCLDTPTTHPFDTGCLPLNYSGNPGVNGESDRGTCATQAKGVGFSFNTSCALTTVRALPVSYAVQVYSGHLTGGVPVYARPL
jgi:hypothetical protein